MLNSFCEKVIFLVRHTTENDNFALENDKQKHNLILTKLLTLIHYL
jgi:hypothetical protein